MKLFHTKLDLFDDEDFRLNLRLTRNKLFKIHDTYLKYDWDPDHLSTYLDIYTFAIDQEEAEAKIRIMIDLLSFLYDYDLLLGGAYYVREVENFGGENAFEKDEVKNKNILKLIEVQQIIKELPSKEQKIVLQCIRYYARALKLYDLELYEEALLTSYKAQELIVNYLYNKNYKERLESDINNVVPHLLESHFNEKYLGNGTDKEIFEDVSKLLKELVTARRKTTVILDHLGLSKYKDEVGEFVRVRNRIGAHSNSGKMLLNEEIAAQCIHLAKKIISRYLSSEDEKLVYLDGQKTDDL
jgi:hypothetical protein